MLFRGLIAAYIFYGCVMFVRNRTVPYGIVGHACAGIYICCGGSKFEVLQLWRVDPHVPGVFGIRAIIICLFSLLATVGQVG